MKKKIKYIIACVIILILSFFYAHVDKACNIYDSKIDNSNYLTIPMEDMVSVSQSFICEEEYLDGFAAKILVNSTSASGKMTYLLTDKNENEIEKGEFSLLDMKSGRINKFKFEKRIDNCKGKKIFFTIGVTGLNEGENVILSYVGKNAKGCELTIDGEKTNGTLVFRTITHRFDIETFIMVIAFAIYFVVFFRILYKLFS